MKFLANENIPISVTKGLATLGYDIVRADEIKKGMTDSEILDISLAEGRVLITFDKDFAELIVKEKKKARGVILLRIEPKSADFIKERLLALFSKVSALEQKFIIVKENVIRERPLK